MISLSHITKYYGSTPALSDVCCNFAEGKVTGLIGANGAGKTTLLRIIAGLIDDFSGQVEWGGAVKHTTGYLPEQRGLFADQKVGEQLLFFARLNGLARPKADENVDFWLRRLGAHEWRDRKISQLSKGMAQKVQFMASVVHDPDVLLFDEPMSGLDPLHAAQLRDIINELRLRGKTIVMSTHNLDEAARLCNEYVILRCGAVTYSGAAHDVDEQKILSLL